MEEEFRTLRNNDQTRLSENATFLSTCLHNIKCVTNENVGATNIPQAHFPLFDVEAKCKSPTFVFLQDMMHIPQELSYVLQQKMSSKWGIVDELLTAFTASLLSLRLNSPTAATSTQ